MRDDYTNSILNKESSETIAELKRTIAELNKLLEMKEMQLRESDAVIDRLKAEAYERDERIKYLEAYKKVAEGNDIPDELSFDQRKPSEIVRIYEENVYGKSTGGLNDGLDELNKTNAEKFL